jgi:hypothetical protein
MHDCYIHVSIFLARIVHFQFHVRINLTFLGLPSLLLIPISKPKLLKKIEQKKLPRDNIIEDNRWCRLVSFSDLPNLGNHVQGFWAKRGAHGTTTLLWPNNAPSIHPLETTLIKYNSLVNQPQQPSYLHNIFCKTSYLPFFTLRR